MSLGRSGYKINVFPETLAATESSRTTPRLDAGQVLEALEDFCQSLHPGDLVPSHVELMRRFDASERSVRWALDELRRQGKIVRRRGARTFVAEPRVAAKSGNAVAQPAHMVDSSRTVVAIATPDHSLFDQAMKLLLEKAQSAELSILCHLLPGPGSATTWLPALPEEPLGYIVFRGDALPLAERLQSEGHRVVLVGTPTVDVTPNVPTVHGDHDMGGYLACKHLIELGHRRIGHCGSPNATNSLRWQGHQRAIAEAARRGIEIQNSLVYQDDILSWKEKPIVGAAFFRSADAPTALTVWNDHEAVILMALLARLGLRVPDDISIVGYDNLPEGQVTHPALTTVDSSIDQQLQAAINLLTKPQMPTGPYQLVTLPILIPRESSAPPVS